MSYRSSSAVVRRLPVAFLAAVVGLSAVSPAPAQQTTRPATTASNEIPLLVTRIRKAQRQLNETLQGGKVLADPAERQKIMPEALALTQEMLSAVDELVAVEPRAQRFANSLRDSARVTAIALGDEAARATAEKDAADNNPTIALRAQSMLIQADWMTAADTAAQNTVVDRLEKLANNNKADANLTIITNSMIDEAKASETADRLSALVLETFTNPAAEQIKLRLEADAKQKALENKPLTIAGKLIDGNDFSTADWKGKVVLVDFWATWCGPCIAEMPNLKKLYDTYHDKGFEIVGISNDTEGANLTKYVDEQNIAWPQLFDNDAAAQKQWHSLSQEYGVMGIPTMFLIDKKGILRTVKARGQLEELVPQLLAE